MLSSLASEMSLNLQEQTVIENYLISLTNGNDYVRLDEFHGLLDNLERSILKDDPTILARKRGFKYDKIVDVQEFAESREYLGLKGELWASTLDNLWQIFHDNDGNYYEIILSGAAGTGKSHTSWISLAYQSYLLGSLWDPQAEFEADRKSPLLLIIQSQSIDTASDAVFRKLIDHIDESPWFNNFYCRDKKINDCIIFPNNVEVRVISGKPKAGLGKDIFSAVISEINEMPELHSSVHLQHSDKMTYDVGMEMYTTIKNRIKTRFSRFGGGFPGKLIIDSARSHEGDFTEKKKIERDLDIQRRGYSNILIIERSTWEAQAHKFVDEPRFLVDLGNEQVFPRIINSRDEATDPEDEATVLEVPESFRKDFENDIEKALKDYGGIPTSRKGRFIPYSEKITLASQKFIDKNGSEQLFKLNDVNFNQLFGDSQSPDWNLLINEDYLKKLVAFGGTWAIHVDLSSSGNGDATGIAVGRIIGSVIIESGKFIFGNDKVQDIPNLRCPVYFIDGVLRVFAKPGEQINFLFIQDLILQLKKYIDVKYASADWIGAGIQMIQAWQAAEIFADYHSVDRTPRSYLELKEAIRSERITFPYHPVLDKEIRRLRSEVKTRYIKVDHPPGVNESKDLSDALAGVVGVLQRGEGPSIYEMTEDSTPAVAVGRG